MNWINDNSILIVGLGLMGGSMAKGLKRLGFHVEGIDNRQESIDYAIQNKIIDRGYAFPDETAIRNADVMIFALYPEVLKKWIREQQHLFKQGLLITDVTGVKSCIVYDIQSMLRDDVEYVPAHPMAGREVCGVENADDSIFRGANFIVAPTRKNTEEGIAWCRGLGQILGFRKISLLSPEEHDEMIGFVSQLTHVIAVSLMTCNDNTHLVEKTVKKGSRRDGHKLSEYAGNGLVVMIQRGEESIIPNGDTILYAGDRLILFDMTRTGENVLNG